MRAIFKSLILILLVTTISTTTGYAEDGNDQPPTPQLPIKKKKPGDVDPFRPKAPSFVQILFSYDIAAGEASFEFPAYVEYIDIEAENLDTHIIYMGSASVDFPVWHQELPSGEYIITCTADNGDVFERYVYI